MNIKEEKSGLNRSRKLSQIACFFSIFFLILTSLSIVSALDVQIKSNFNYYTSDFYALTNSNADTGYDGYDAPKQPMQTNESRLFSWCREAYPVSLSWNNCTFAIDSFPASNRTFYLVYQASPSITNTLNLSWNPAIFGSTYDAILIDYGTDYNYATPASPGYDMESNSFYATTATAGYRYFTMKLSYFAPPPSGGPSGGCTETAPTCTLASQLDCGKAESKSNCAGNCSSTGTKCDVAGETCNTNTGECEAATNCTDTCASLGYNCGEVCGKPCGTCTNGECISGVCISENCTNPCSPLNSRECSGANAFRVCKDIDNDNCPQWQITECGTNEICTGNGLCENAGCLNDNNCPENYQCTNYQCILIGCIANCTGKSCGSDGCGGNCETCSLGYICSSGSCQEGEPPENISQDILNGCKKECDYSYICGEWSDCAADYEIGDLLGVTSVIGSQTRTCVDKRNCCPSFNENQTCDFKEEVIVESRVWCNQNYTEVKDKHGTVLARLSSSSTSDKSSYSIDFNVGGEGYCPYCYDGIQNYDETGIDCGGSCMSCELRQEMLDKKFKLPFWRTTWFVILWLVLLMIALITTAVYILAELYKDYRDSRLFGKWIRKYEAWQKKGYDAEVLNRDLNTLKQRAGSNSSYNLSKKR